MMEKNNLIENIRDFFKEKYDGIKGSESFLSFEPIGSPIDPSDFKDSLGNISEAKAIEELSIIGDRLPEINDLFYSDSSRLSSAYSLLVKTAAFNTDLIEEDVLSTFSHMKSAVEAKLEHFENASLITPQGRYLPINPSIKKWFDPKGSFWIKKSFSIQEKDNKKSDKKSKSSGLKMPLTWRTNFVTNSNVLKAITKDNTVKIAKKSKVNASTLIQFEPKVVSYKLAAIQVHKPKTKMSRIKLKAGKKQAALVLKNKTKPVKSMQWNNLNLLKHLQVSERLQFTGQLAIADTANLKPVESDHFTMSFEYCIVNLDRPWLDRILFDVPEWWYCKSLDESFFSNGEKNKSNNGILKCYTTAMILIKNLEISASWSEDDKANAKESIALGNFNITDSEFHGNKLKSNGIQVIGWMCNVLPKLPLISSPKTNN